MSSLIRPARIGFALVAWLFVACVLVQVYLAGLGVFNDASAWITHREFGYLFGILTLVMVALAALGRLPMVFIGGSALALILFATQSVFVFLWQDAPAVAALHPLNGFIILFVAVGLAWRATSYLRQEAPAG